MQAADTLHVDHGLGRGEYLCHLHILDTCIVAGESTLTAACIPQLYVVDAAATISVFSRKVIFVWFPRYSCPFVAVVW